MMPFEALTQQDKDFIISYIETFGGIGRNVSLEKPLSTILRFWNYNKERLFHIFGDQLILKRQMTIDLDLDDKRRAIDDYYASKEPGAEFQRAFYKWTNKKEYCSQDWKTNTYIRSLVVADYIYNNRVPYSFEYKDKSGKVIKVPEGAKVMKVLQKIAKQFDLPEFEDFRNRISRITEVRTTDIEITLSIHPLDYMTMSDNNNGWESCMNWTCGPGAYRAGTVEMMNSDCVVMAYTSTKDYDVNDIITWNSKSWRTLAIVNPYIITTVKDYPHSCKNFDKAVVDWLVELCEAYTNWRYQSKYIEDFDCSEDNNIYLWDDDHRISFLTNAMYNDFDNGCHNVARVSIDPPMDDTYEIIYSGEWSCMCCGEEYEIYQDDGDNDIVVCGNCDELFYCDHCGDRIRGDTYNIDDVCLCTSCFENLDTCMVCEKPHTNSYMSEVYVANSVNGLIDTKYNRHFMCLECQQNNYAEARKVFGDLHISERQYNGAPFWGDTILVIDEDSIEKDLREDFKKIKYGTCYPINSYTAQRFPGIFTTPNESWRLVYTR